MRAWNELSMTEKADVMKLAIDGGVYDLDAIRNGYNEFAKGGKIHIKPENRGKFTRLKERTGKSASWFKAHGTPAQKKMATFALNAGKWKHEDGGNLLAHGGEMGNYYDGWGDFKNFLKKAYHGVKQLVGLEDTPEEASLKRGQARYSQYGYIGGEPRETRQKYFDLDKELTDSVNSISRRYGLNPSIVASRMAEEGPIDAAVNEYNDEDNLGTRGLILSDNNRGTHGPLWGLDDFYSRNQEGKTAVTTSAPHSFKKHMFINEHGRLTESVTSPQWWFGIEATAAEMKARRDKLKKNNPWMDNKTLDAATAMSFNYGETGVQKHINKKKSIPKRFNPYIKTK